MTGHDGESVEVRRNENDEPVQFVWQNRLYIVRSVLAHWVETTPWWSSPTTTGVPADIGEREYWRVEAMAGAAETAGVYELRFDWSVGQWSVRRTDVEEGGT